MHPPPPSSIHLYPAPPSSNHLHSTHFSLHPAPSTSTQLISASTQLSATPSTIFEPKYSRNWAISPNLGQKIKSCPFWLKIGTHGILEVLIPNPDFDFWNSYPKSIFGQIWAQKVKVVCFVWKLVHMISQRYWFLFQH